MNDRRVIIWPYYTVKELSEEEAAKYRQMPVGLEQKSDVIRSVAEEDGNKYIFELNADGFEWTKVRA